MSLSAALQERLLKRGIIKKDTAKADAVEEEVIAESYDEPSNSSVQTVCSIISLYSYIHTQNYLGLGFYTKTVFFF